MESHCHEQCNSTISRTTHGGIDFDAYKVGSIGISKDCVSCWMTSNYPYEVKAARSRKVLEISCVFQRCDDSKACCTHELIIRAEEVQHNTDDGLHSPPSRQEAKYEIELLGMLPRCTRGTCVPNQEVM